MSKIRLIILLSLCIVAIAAIIIAVVLITPIVKVNSYVEEGEYYEAYKIITDKDLTNSEHYNNPSIKFFDVMARHYKEDIIGEGTWKLPDMTGWSCAEIAYALNNIGQPYRIEFVDDSSKRSNIVVEQFPKSGQEVSKNEVITLKTNSFSAGDNLYSSVYFLFSKYAEVGEWLYYADDNKIYKSRIDGSEKTLFYEYEKDDKFIVSMLGRSNYLYFVLSESNKDFSEERKFYIQSMNLKDLSIKEIYRKDLFCNFKVYDSKMYITEADTYVLDLESGDFRLYRKKQADYIVYKDFEYYFDTESSTLIKKNLDGSNEEILISTTGSIKDLVAIGNYIYYRELKPTEYYESVVLRVDEYLMRYDLETTETKVLNKLSKDAYSLGDYIISYWNDCVLATGMFGNSFKYDVSTEKETKIYPADYLNNTLLEGNKYFAVDSFSICGNYIYYIVGCFDEEYSCLFTTGLYEYRYNIMTDELEEFNFAE